MCALPLVSGFLGSVFFTGFSAVALPDLKLSGKFESSSSSEIKSRNNSSKQKN